MKDKIVVNSAASFSICFYLKDLRRNKQDVILKFQSFRINIGSNEEIAMVRLESFHH
jgi:hypothetical protein